MNATSLGELIEAIDRRYDRALAVGQKLAPASKFSFKTTKVKIGDALGWQISLLQDRGDRTEPFVYVHGEGMTQDEAMAQLTGRLPDKVQQRIAEVTAEAQKTADRFAAELASLNEALALSSPSP